MTDDLKFLSGAGEMGALIRTYNWQSSALGPANKWPQSLRTTLSILLNSKFPMFLYWGPQSICFYNDAYRFSLGNDGRHPSILGMKGEEAWPETWHIIKPSIDQVNNKSEATWSEDQFIPIYRNGTMKDAYWTFSFSPVINESNETAGVFLTLIETTENVNNLKKIKETNDQLTFAIEATELGTFDFNPITNKFIANNRLKDWFGLPHEMEVDLNLAIEVMVENDRSRVANAIQQTLQYQSGGLYDIEYSIINPVTKQERIVRAKGRAWFGEDKTAYRFTGTLQDITEQANARIKIKESEQRFRNLTSQAPVLISTFEGPSYKVATINKKALDILGKTYDEIINKPLFEVSPETEETLKTIFNNVYTTGEPFISNEYMVQLKRSGKPTTAYFNTVYQPLRDGDDKIYGIIAIGTEVTETINARKLIEANGLMIQNIYMNAPASICTFRGPQHIYELVNPAYQKLFDNRALVGKPLLEALPELKGQSIDKILDNVYNTGEIITSTEIPVMIARADNLEPEQRYYNTTMQPIYDEAHKIIGVVNFGFDVTEQLMARKKIEESEKRFSNILSQSLMAIAIFKGPDMVVAFCNEPMLIVLGKGNAILNIPLLQAVPELKDQVFPQLLADVYTTGVAFEGFETKAILVRNGIPVDVYLNFVYQPYRDVDDTITGITVLATDVTEQVLAKKQIIESEKRISNILSQSIMSIGILKGADMVVTLVNETLLKIWGKGPDIVGKPLLEVMPELASQPFPKQLNDVFITGIPYTFNENRTILMNNGIPEERFFSIVIQPYTEVDNTVSGVTVIGTEVTNYVQAKKQIEESEQKFRDLFNSMDQGVCIIEMIIDEANNPLNYRFLECNPVFNKQTGLQNVINKTARELMPDLDNFWFDTFRNVVLTQQPVRFSQKADALGRWFDVYAFPFENEGSNKVAIIFTDISEKKLIDEKIKESEENFRGLAETLPHLVWMTNEKGEQLYASKRWEEYSGLNPNDESNWQRMVHPGDMEAITNTWTTSLATGLLYHFEARLKNKHGEYRWHVVEGVPLTNSDEKITKWIGAFTDIHEQKIKEQQKDEFISIASHEMKTPLTTAKGYIELLMLSLSEENQTALYARKANQAVEKLNELVTDLLDASKIQNGKLNYSITTFDFNAMVHETIENFQLSAKNHLLHKSGNSSRQITGDRGRLQQVLINLLSNAEKYSPKANKVLINIEEKDSKIQVSVQDFGLGMTRQHLDKIFDRYYRVQEHSIQFQGLGIGLYICNNIIERHNGTMWAESEPEEGSTFYFTIPIQL